jgi:hypothetical protein
MATHDEASRLALLKLYGQKMGAYGQISSDLPIYRHPIPNGDCRWSLPEFVTDHINEGKQQAKQHLGARRTLGPPPLLGRSAAPHDVAYPLAVSQSRSGNSWAPLQPPAPCGDEGTSHVESPEPGIVPPLRPQQSPRSLKKTGAATPASISTV